MTVQPRPAGQSRTWFVHIGIHKTGTSSLQRFLSERTEALSRHGVLYPVVDRSGNQGAFAQSLKHGVHPQWVLRAAAGVQRAVTAWDGPVILLSSEVFPEQAAVAARLRDFIPAGDQVTVVAYLRNQVDWLQSVMDEVVRNQRQRFTGTLPEVEDYRAGLYDYAVQLQPWIDAFGAESMLLRPFDDIVAAGGSLTADLIGVLGLPDSIAAGPVPQANPRMPALATEFLRRVNRFPMLDADRRVVVDGLQAAADRIGALAGPVTLMDPEFATAVRDEQAPRNAELFRRLPPHAPTTLFPESAERRPAQGAAQLLDAQLQRQVYEAMPEKARTVLAKWLPRIVELGAGWSLAPASQVPEQRLAEVVRRQNRELDLLSAQLAGRRSLRRWWPPGR